MVTAGATVHTTEGNSRASSESGLLRSHSYGESIVTEWRAVFRSALWPASRAHYRICVPPSTGTVAPCGGVLSRVGQARVGTGEGGPLREGEVYSQWESALQSFAILGHTRQLTGIYSYIDR